MTANGEDTDTDETAATLRQVAEVRQRTRRTVHPAWFPLLLFGTLGLLSIPFGFLGHGVGSGLFWIVAGPSGGYATAQYYRKRAMTTGVGVRGRAYTVLGVALFLAAWIGGAVTGKAAAPMLAVAIGYLGFAYLERSWGVATAAAALGVAAAIVAVTDPAHADVILTLVFGLSFAGTGLLLRYRDPAS